MPAHVILDLARALVSSPEDGHLTRWVNLPGSVRTISAFESWLRDMHWGNLLATGRLEFLRAGGLVEDTGCLIGGEVEVVVGGGQRSATEGAATAAQQLHVAGKQAGSSSDSERQALTPQSGAEGEAVGGLDDSQGVSSAPGAAEPVDGAGDQRWSEVVSGRLQPAVRQLSRRERLEAVKQMSEEEKAAIRAAGIPEDATEDGMILPALDARRVGGQGPPAGRGIQRRCHHCGIDKFQIFFHPFMWKQDFPCVCSLCESKLKCSTCPPEDGRNMKRPKAFSRTQARLWDGSRRCKCCIRAAVAAQELAAQVKRREMGIQLKFERLRRRLRVLGGATPTKVVALARASGGAFVRMFLLIHSWRRRAVEAAGEVEMQEEDDDFGPPGAGVESDTQDVLLAAEAEAVAAEERRMQEILDSGSIFAGTELVVCERGQDVVAQSATGKQQMQCMLKIGSSVVVQRDWEHRSGADVLVAGSSAGRGWLVLDDGSRQHGVFYVSPSGLARPYRAGAVGTTRAEPDGQEGSGELQVEVFHWPGEVEISGVCGRDGDVVSGSSGHVEVGRRVQVVAVAEWARYREDMCEKEDMLLVEDADPQECQLDCTVMGGDRVMVDYSMDLNFDKERSCGYLQGEDRWEIPGGPPGWEEPRDTDGGGKGSGCVVEMELADSGTIRVKRSAVWIRESSWCSATLREWTAKA